MNPQEIRRTYAETLRAIANLRVEAIVEAFARVPREEFLGPPPWQVGQVGQPFNPAVPFATKPDAGLEDIYQDVVVTIDPARQINNGQPSVHARWLEAVSPQPGESVLHIGCGVGYYTSILAELVGPSGRVVAYEIEPDIATRAQACLQAWPQVRAELGDASQPGGPYDVVYVNAGATHARKEWLSSLTEKGRILLPLTVHLPMFPQGGGVGFVICAKRCDGRWPVRVVGMVGIYDCAGARDPMAESQLRKFLSPDAAARIQALSIEPHIKGDRCLVHLDGFCLQT
jgi:protein-L-isoaspartate(D-aspartate) O-methyltransferase